jgi:hypothetical protein
MSFCQEFSFEELRKRMENTVAIRVVILDSTGVIPCTVTKSTLCSVEEEVDDSTLPVRKESAAITVAASTCITPDKEMNIKPVLTEPMPMLKATKNKEEQNIMVSERAKLFASLALFVRDKLDSESRYLSFSHWPSIGISFGHLHTGFLYSGFLNGSL